MSEENNHTCYYCGSEAHIRKIIDADVRFICDKCNEVREKALLDITPCWAKGYGGEQEKIWCGQEYAKAAGLGVLPLPCVRDEHGEIKEQTVKALFSKINEELDELKTEITYHGVAVIADSAADAKEKLIQPLDIKSIAEEAADTITAITTMLEALGIDAEMRDEAQRRVNAKNRERGRL